MRNTSLRTEKFPCCVDQRGADPVPENDSNGEFIYAVAEYYRYTRDVGFVSDMWPATVKAVEYIALLRQQRTTEAFQRPDKQAFYGLLPESISHEGYSSHPVHSYWDDFFALRGLKDAASLAVVVGDDEHAASFAALRDAFRTDLYASIDKAMANHKIDYIPGFGRARRLRPDLDGDRTHPAGELAYLPRAGADAHLRQVLRARPGAATRRGPGDDAYTPYELRNVDALVLLGQRDRALEILNYMLADQRPPAWNEWAEVVWRDASAPSSSATCRTPGWARASSSRCARMFAYEREADHALVIAAGLPSAWVMSETGVSVRRLPTYEGVLSYSLRGGRGETRCTCGCGVTSRCRQAISSSSPPPPPPLTPGRGKGKPGKG